MLRKKLKSPRIWIWVLGIALLVSSIVAVVAWYFSRKWKPVLDTQLKELVLRSTDSLYHIEYSGFHLNLVTGNASVTDFKLIPNKEVYARLVQAKKAPDNLYDLTVNRLVIRGFHPKRLYSEKRLNVATIVVDNPTLFITNRRQAYNDVDTADSSRTLYEIISKVFKEVRVDKIVLKDVDFTFDNRSNRVAKKTLVKNLNITATDLLIDSAGTTDPKRFYHTKNIEVFLNSYRIATSDSLYYLNFRNFAFSAADRKLSIERVSLDPRYSRTKFYEKVGYAKDRFHLIFNNVALSNVNLNQFTRNQKLYAGKLGFARAAVEVFNNSAYEKKRGDKTGKFPHQQLQKLALDLAIDTVRIRNTTVTYSEFNPVSKRTGRVSFNRTEGAIYHLTNDSAALRKSPLMHANFESHFMDAGKLSLQFEFNLRRKDGTFTCNGTLGSMDGRVLNNITKPLGLVQINSVKVDKLRFSIRANQNIARGKVNFYYRNLNVTVFKEDDDGKIKRQGLASSVANVFILHEDNPTAAGKFTGGTIYYRRENWQSFFSFIWKSLFTGVKESVGVSEEKEKKIRRTVTKIGNFIEKLKERHQERKQQRKEKREDRREEKRQQKEEKEARRQDRKEQKAKQPDVDTSAKSDST